MPEIIFIWYAVINGIFRLQLFKKSKQLGIRKLFGVALQIRCEPSL